MRFCYPHARRVKLKVSLPLKTAGAINNIWPLATGPYQRRNRRNLTGQYRCAQHLRQIGFLPLLALFYGYTAGGPFGYEAIFTDSGPGMALVFLAFVPLFWSIPISLASAELNSVFPVQGGFSRWSRAAFGDFWGFQCGWWN